MNLCYHIFESSVLCSAAASLELAAIEFVYDGVMTERGPVEVGRKWLPGRHCSRSAAALSPKGSDPAADEGLWGRSNVQEQGRRWGIYVYLCLDSHHTTEQREDVRGNSCTRFRYTRPWHKVSAWETAAAAASAVCGFSDRPASPSTRCTSFGLWGARRCATRVLQAHIPQEKSMVPKGQEARRLYLASACCRASNTSASIRASTLSSSEPLPAATFNASWRLARTACKVAYELGDGPESTHEIHTSTENASRGAASTALMVSLLLGWTVAKPPET